MTSCVLPMVIGMRSKNTAIANVTIIAVNGSRTSW